MRVFDLAARKGELEAEFLLCDRDGGDGRARPLERTGLRARCTEWGPSGNTWNVTLATDEPATLGSGDELSLSGRDPAHNPLETRWARERHGRRNLREHAPQDPRPLRTHDDRRCRFLPGVGAWIGRRPHVSRRWRGAGVGRSVCRGAHGSAAGSRAVRSDARAPSGTPATPSSKLKPPPPEGGGIVRGA
jgi:hypothetical protein